MTLTLPLALLGLLVMVLGEVWRMAAPGLVRDSPLTQATAVALAISTAWPAPPGDQDRIIGLLGPLLLLVAAVVGVALVRRQLRGTGADLARLLTSALVAGVLVRIPGSDGVTLLQAAEEGRGRPIVVAALLLLVTVVAMTIPLVARAVPWASRRHRSLRTQLAEDLGRHAPLALAMASIAVVMALGLRVLGPISLVLFLVPLVVLQPAVGRQRRIRMAQRQTISALARLTDQAGLTTAGHGARVAALAVPLARDVGVEEPDLVDVEAAALLHDLGQVGLSRPIPGGATVEVCARDQRRIAAAGAAILARTAELSRLSAWVGDVGVPQHRAEERGDVALVSRVIRVASAYDDLTGHATRLTGAHGPVEAVERLVRGTPHDYDPRVVDALVRRLERTGVLSPGQASALRP